MTILKIQQPWPLMFYAVKVDGRSEPGDIKYFQNYSFVYVDPVGFGGIIAAGVFGYIGIRRLKLYHKIVRGRKDDK